MGTLHGSTLQAALNHDLQTIQMLWKPLWIVKFLVLSAVVWSCTFAGNSSPLVTKKYHEAKVP